ncbi:MAG: hypothetical protein GEU96_18420 [Propionibacteriales bacterium]|nr:hypothetical protein [Propionibacteriales bacterium]
MARTASPEGTGEAERKARQPKARQQNRTAGKRRDNRTASSEGTGEAERRARQPKARQQNRTAPKAEFTTWGSAVNVRAAPTTAATVVRTLRGATAVDVSCQQAGERVKAAGHTNHWWSYVPALGGYITNIFIDHPAAKLPGVPECSGAAKKQQRDRNRTASSEGTGEAERKARRPGAEPESTPGPRRRDGRTASSEGTGEAERKARRPRIPRRPKHPTPDPGAGEHGSKPGSQRANLATAKALVATWQGMGLTNAARHLQHFLDNTGDDLTVDVESILGDIARFRSDVLKQVEDTALPWVERGIDKRLYGDHLTFKTGWKTFRVWTKQNPDWYYAIGGFKFSVTGYVVVSSGSPPTAVAHYKVHVFDRYNWDTREKSARSTDMVMGSLHEAGLAREYDIVGSTGKQVLSVPRPRPSPSPGPSPR